MSALKNPTRILGILLLVAGTYGLIYHGVNYTKETHTAEIGPVHLQVAEKDRLHIPQWAAISGIAVGAVLLMGSRKV